MAYEVFISYSHQDQPLRQKLDNHLANLKRQNIITSWYDGEITAGTNWQPQIMQHLNNAQIILLLISDDFMASDFCYSIEMTQAISRHDANQARVIPIILRPVDWQGAPFEKIQALPTGGKPVTDWPNQDSAFLDIVQGMRKAINDLTIKGAPTNQERLWNIPYARNFLFTGREEVLKDQMDEGTRLLWAKRVVRAVDSVFPYPEYTKWNICRQYLLHAQICSNLIEQYGLLFTEAATLLNNLGFYLLQRGEYEQVESLHQRALTINEEALGTEHGNTASSLSHLAFYYNNQGKYEQAEPLCQQALAICERALGPDHPTTVTIRKNYADLKEKMY